MEREEINSGKATENSVVVPYLPSFSWYVRYLQAILRGCGEQEARLHAAHEPILGSKDYSRARLSDNLRLKIPLEGSSSAKNLPAEALTISGHGDWRHTHLGAISAAFGRTPFYVHLIDRITDTLNLNGDPSAPLSNLTETLHKIMTDILFPGDFVNFWRNIPGPDRERAISRGMELTASLPESDRDPALSLLSYLMKLGPEVIFPLLAAALKPEPAPASEAEVDYKS